MDKRKLTSKTEFINTLKDMLPTLEGAKATEVMNFLEQEAIKGARSRYSDFVKYIGPYLMEDFNFGRHMEIICDRLEKAAHHAMQKGENKDRKKLQISLPPASSKTQLCLRMFAAWVFGVYPKARIIAVSHGLVFGKDEIGMKVMDTMRLNEYRRIFPNTELSDDKQTAGRFLTTQGGELFITSIEAGNAGRRGHFLISDDAVVEKDAFSKDVRTKLNSDYVSNLRTRFVPGYKCAEICLGTRWVQGDLFDFLEKSDKKLKNKFEIVRIPALLDLEASDFMRKEGDPDGYMEVGTSFWPEMYSTEYFDEKKKEYRHQPSRFSALYLQKPIPDDGQILSTADFRLWQEPSPPPYHTLVLTLDTAYTTNTQSDYTAYQLWGIFNRTEDQKTKPNLILMNAEKGKWDFPELIKKIEGLWLRKHPDFVLIEDRSSGLALIPELRNRGIPVVGWKTNKDKVLRMQACAPLVKSGIVWVPFPNDREDVCAKSMEFVAEIAEFPGGNSDDAADAMSQAILWMRDSGMLLGENYVTTEEEFYGSEDGDGVAGFSSYTSALLN